MTDDLPIIRLLTVEDYNQVQKIDEELFPLEPYDKADFLTTLKNPTRLSLGLLLGNEELLGTLKLSFQSITGHLLRIGVAKRYQGRGYGKKLMVRAIEEFKKRKLQRIILYVLKENVPALTLYRKYGFTTIQQSWQYIVPFKDIKGEEGYGHQKVTRKDFPRIESTYSIPVERLETLAIDDRNILIEFTKEERPIGFCRFSSWFPGAFPFVLLELSAFDGVVRELMCISLPKYDYVRLTFEDNDRLAKLLDERRFSCHHDMFVMERKLNEKLS